MKEEIEKIKLEAVKRQTAMKERSEMIMRKYKSNPDSISALEMVKLDEGTTMHFAYGRLDGIIETCDKILEAIKGELEPINFDAEEFIKSQREEEKKP